MGERRWGRGGGDREGERGSWMLWGAPSLYAMGSKYVGTGSLPLQCP